jgi:hypothetical protein
MALLHTGTLHKIRKKYHGYLLTSTKNALCPLWVAIFPKVPSHCTPESSQTYSSRWCPRDHNHGSAFSLQLADHWGKKKEDDYVQIGDVPRIDQRLDNKPIVRRFPKNSTRSSLPAPSMVRISPCSSQKYPTFSSAHRTVSHNTPYS